MLITSLQFGLGLRLRLRLRLKLRLRLGTTGIRISCFIVVVSHGFLSSTLQLLSRDLRLGLRLALLLDLATMSNVFFLTFTITVSVSVSIASTLRSAVLMLSMFMLLRPASLTMLLSPVIIAITIIITATTI